MKNVILKTVLLAIAAMASPAAASAQPPAASVVWTLNNFTFAGGATATGNFEWAPDTDQVLSWDIIMSSKFSAGSDGNSILRYSNQLANHSVSSNAGFLQFVGLGFLSPFSFSFGVVPTDLDVASARVDPTVTQIQFQSWNFLECGPGCTATRKSADITSAYLSSIPTVLPPTTVPEPTTVSLMAVGMLMLGAAARRKRRV